jgi:hypothetical protein
VMSFDACHAGCPFRHSDVDGLRQKLQSLEVSSSGINEVCPLVVCFLRMSRQIKFR